MPPLPDVPQLLAAAVEALGGTERSGQITMASAVAHAIDTRTHLAVQAGTGTGKSLAYLVPGIRHALETGRTVVVSTATIALQRQLVERDLPRLANALGPLLGEEPEFAILKGRNNYLCLNKIRSGSADDPAEPELFDAFAISRLGRDVQRLHKWAEQTETGDRDEVVPGVGDRAWRQLSVTARECLGKARCPHGVDCFAELARTRSAHADVVVTNHALLAIDAITGMSVLPEHDVVIVDEAHELVDRVTGVATAELSPAAITAAVRRTGKLVPEDELDRMAAAADALERLLDELNPGRWDAFPSGADATLALVRDAAWAVRTAVEPTRSGPVGPRGRGSARRRPRRPRRGARRRRADAARVRRTRPSRPHGRGVARGEQRQAHDPDRTAVGGWSAADAVVRDRDRDPDVGDAATRRFLRRAGPHLGAARARTRPAHRRGARDRRRTAGGRGRRWRGPHWTSVPRSTTPARASSTSRDTCRRRGATGWRRRIWTRSNA